MKRRDLRPLSPPRRALRPRERAFTLIELMVAMAAGLAVAAAAMTLSKNAVNFFQHEARISAAQLSLTLGMNRITQDLQRAALLSSPNLLRDSTKGQLCGDMTDYPAGLKDLAGITLLKGGSTAAAPQSKDNGLNPDIIEIGGSLSTSEQFAIRSIDSGAAGAVILRLENDDAMKRTRARALAGAGEDILTLFADGRFVRIVDQAFKHEYGVISGLAEGPPGDPYVDVTLSGDPAVPTSGMCGLYGHETGALVSVIYRVRYEIGSMTADKNYKALVAGDPATEAITGDSGRTELIRSELDATGAPLLDTSLTPPELIAEYAVDLKFGVESAAWDPATKTYAVTRHAIRAPEDALVYAIAGLPSAGGSPETIRAVQVRLATRTRTPDRATDVDIDVGQAADGRLARFFIKDVTAGQTYARTRTLYSDIYLPNQAGVQ